MVVHPEVFGVVLHEAFGHASEGDLVFTGESVLHKKLGEKLASEIVTIIDEGTVEGGYFCPFDDEGHPTQRTPVIKDGILKNYIYDTYTALKDDVQSTGNAQRSYYWMNPQPSPNNLILKTGEASPEEIIRGTKRGIYIEDTIGEWLSNPISGNLNATITHGYLVENGELAEPIKGVVVSGNFYEILKDGIEIIANDLRNSAQNYSPTVKLAELTIAGKQDR